MAKKAGFRTKAGASAQAQLLDLMHQVWLAGLGAVAMAQRGTPKLLNELVSEGARMHADTRDAAEKALRGAFGDVSKALNAGVAKARGRASDAFENLEKIFQTRVHRALTQLGVPSAEEVRSLGRRVESLNAAIDRLARSRKAAPRARRPAARARMGAAPRATASAPPAS